MAQLLPRLQVNVVVVVALLFYVHGKHLRSCRDGCRSKSQGSNKDQNGHIVSLSGP